MELSEADLIWNRAALEGGGPQARGGDKALAGLLRAHGMFCSGGLTHAVEMLSAEQIREAIEGFRYFGLTEASSLLEDAVAPGNSDDASLDAVFDDLDERYGSIVPTDETLAARFRERLVETPGDFAP